MTVPGKFITLEGIEGAGKSTAIKHIKHFLTEQGITLVTTREPGGTDIAERIRSVLVMPAAEAEVETLTPITELLLFFAARAQHIEHVIRPALARGEWVLSDRFTDASFAYQGAGRVIPIETVALLEQWVGNCQPDCTLLLDLPVELGMSRLKNRHVIDRIEAERHEFFEKVRQCYLERAKQYTDRFSVINAAQPVKKVKHDIRDVLQGLIAHAG